MINLNYKREKPDAIIGTCKQGEVTAIYAELVLAFGQPDIMTDYDKITHLWVLNIEGVICTIYDYKEDLKTGFAEHWHIGSRQKIAERLVNEIIDQKRVS